MRTKILILFVTLLCSFTCINAQVYNPYYAYYNGVTYMPLPNGYYYGWVSYGSPNGEGYAYVYENGWGWIIVHGNFSQGVVHGYAEILSAYGYLCGTWNYGQFVGQYDVPQYQMQQTYNQAYNSYNQYVAPQSNTYSNPSTNDFADSNIKITQIDSDSQLGRQLLGRIGR